MNATVQNFKNNSTLDILICVFKRLCFVTRGRVLTVGFSDFSNTLEFVKLA
jgi:hypothetical protein